MYQAQMADAEDPARQFLLSPSNDNLVLVAERLDQFGGIDLIGHIDSCHRVGSIPFVGE